MFRLSLVTVTACSLLVCSASALVVKSSSFLIMLSCVVHVPGHLQSDCANAAVSNRISLAFSKNVLLTASIVAWFCHASVIASMG